MFTGSADSARMRLGSPLMTAALHIAISCCGVCCACCANAAALIATLAAIRPRKRIFSQPTKNIEGDAFASPISSKSAYFFFAVFLAAFFGAAFFFAAFLVAIFYSPFSQHDVALQ